MNRIPVYFRLISYLKRLPLTNPNYWVYDIPCVNVIHIFAEMPLLGYLGYIPFGIMAWVVFIWLGALFSFDTGLRKNDKDKD